MNRSNVFYILMTLILISCNTHEKTNALYTSKIESQLRVIIDKLIIHESDDPIHNVVLLVEGPNIKWKGAAGMADGKNELMTADHKIKIASIAKTFTATLILQLIEEGYLNLNDTIDKFLDNEIVKLDSLMIFNDVPYGRNITIRELLSHTSGIRDYMEDERFIPDVLEYPQKKWSPEKIMNTYYEYNMNNKAFFKPGTEFDYSDVNYVLLSMIIEKVTETTYQNSLKQRIFDPLNMENSYLEYYDEPRGSAPLSHAFFSTMDLIQDVNTSFDWGGGGIISTCEELNTFFKALLSGQMFKNKSTLTSMLNEADKGRGGTDYDYGFGIQKRKIHGLTFYGHGGAYDCDVFYCPKKDISVCMSLNQMNTHGKRDELLFKVVEIVLDY